MVLIRVPAIVFNSAPAKAAMTVLLWGMVLMSFGLHAQPAAPAHHNFHKADSMAALYPNHSLSDLKRLADKLTGPLATDEDKFRAIYKWVCRNIAYDHTLYLKNKRKREKLQDPQALQAWSRAFSREVFKTLLHKRRTVCTGYAYLVKELANRAGLACEIVDGYGRAVGVNIGGEGTPNHSWNAVQLGRRWYLCDATWSAGKIDTGTGRFFKQYDDSYFLAEPSLFVRNHYPMDTTWLLLDTKPTLHEFLNRPLVYTAAFTYKTDRFFPETFHITAAKGQPVSFRFNSNGNKTVSNAELRIERTGNAVRANQHPGPGEFYCLEHTFAARGRYVVHILLNAEYISSYTVTVK